MAIYTEPTGNDTSGIYEFFNYINGTATEGLFFPIIVLVIWIITFLATKQYSTSRAWTVASFLTSFLSVLLAVANLIDPKWMYLSFVFTAIGIIWLKLEK